MAAPKKKRSKLAAIEALALLFDSSGSGSEIDDNIEKDYRPEKAGKSGSDIDTTKHNEEEMEVKASADPDSWSESEHDDSCLDTDYRPEKDDCSESDSDTGSPQHSEEETIEEEGGERREEIGAALGAAVVKRHKSPRPHTWKRQVIKQKRLKGESFKNAMGQERQPKTMGPPCTSQYCLRSKKRSCELLSDEERTHIFNSFWSMPSWETRKLYIQTLVENVPIKQKKGGAASRRTKSQSYHLQLQDRRKLPVCKNLFCSTLGIAPRTIGSWLALDMKTKTDLSKPKTNSTGPHSPIADTDQTFLNEWLSGLPTVPSHYCRQVPSYQDRKFLEPGTVLSDVYKEYQKAASESGVRVVSETYFRNVFSEQKYSVFVPRKDQCDVCVGAKVGNIDQDTLSTHMKLKAQAQAEKAKDKHESSEKVSVWTMDLQCVLLCPKSKASTMYYKTKLQMHNFTCFNLGNKDGYCYAWEEHEGSLSSEVFAHLQFKHFGSVLEANQNIEKVIVWSDGCGYQNRSCTIANAYIDLAIKHGVTIEQKFLVAGHTQMECDSMHSLIERRTLTDIHTPRDYIVIFQPARLHPSPYKVTQVYHNDFMKLSGAYVTNIRPGKKAGDPTVHDLRALQYLAEGRIRYKLDFESDWEDLPQRFSIPKELFQWIRLFPAQLPITVRKFNDLQAMKPVLPRVAHQYYDNLPHH